jgi:hypothetical protein
VLIISFSWFEQKRMLSSENMMVISQSVHALGIVARYSLHLQISVHLALNFFHKRVYFYLFNTFWSSKSISLSSYGNQCQ